MSGTERWELAEAVFRNERAGLWTTHPPLVDEVLLKLQELIPSARIAHSDPRFEKLGVRLVAFELLDGTDIAARSAIAGIPCKLGWEPLSQFGFRKRYSSLDSAAR